MSLLKRIIDIWTTDADQEIYHVLDEWRIDYDYDEEFLHVIGLIEGHVVDAEYEKAEDLFRDYIPAYMIDDEIIHFLDLIEEAKYYG